MSLLLQFCDLQEDADDDWLLTAPSDLLRSKPIDKWCRLLRGRIARQYPVSFVETKRARIPAEFAPVLDDVCCRRHLDSYDPRLSRGKHMKLSPWSLIENPVPNQNPENTTNTDHPIVFFDGVCGLCNYTVNWLLARDPEHRLRFAPLQGTTAERLLKSEIRDRLDTLVFIRDGRTYIRTAAVSRMLMTLGGLWKVLGGMLWMIPWPIRDLGYRLVSRFRYRMFGKHESCRLPTPQERAVFLD